MYTETIGPNAMWAYLIGGIVVLFSTLFAATAGWSRQFSNAFAELGLLDFTNTSQRGKWIAGLAWIMPIIWAIMFLSFKAPVFMVLLGGIGTSIMLLVVVYAAIYFKTNRLDKRLYSGAVYNVLFWVSAIAIGLLALRGIYSALS